jgi:hypothetical protein
VVDAAAPSGAGGDPNPAVGTQAGAQIIEYGLGYDLRGR